MRIVLEWGALCIRPGAAATVRPVKYSYSCIHWIIAGICVSRRGAASRPRVAKACPAGAHGETRPTDRTRGQSIARSSTFNGSSTTHPEEEGVVLFPVSMQWHLLPAGGQVFFLATHPRSAPFVSKGWREREKGNEHEKGEIAWMEDACSIDQTDAATFATTNLIISVIWLMD